MNDADARRFATEITQRLHQIIEMPDPIKVEKPMTLADILVVGFSIAGALRRAYPDAQPGGFPIPADFLQVMLASVADPNILTEFLYQGLLKSDEDPEKLTTALELETSSRLRQGFRKEMLGVFDELCPPGPPGRFRKITQDDLPNLFKRSERLRPMFDHLLKLRAQFPARDIPSLIEFLKPDYRAQCEYLLNRLPAFEKLTTECSALETTKTAKSKARILADLLASSDYGLSPRYALQKAQEARRLMRGKERNRAPLLPELPDDALSGMQQKS